MLLLLLLLVVVGFSCHGSNKRCTTPTAVLS